MRFMTAARVDHAAEIRARLVDPQRVCASLGLITGYKPGRQAGGGLIIRCPSHNERNPSCSVRVASDRTIAVKCHSCGWGGDVLHLVAVARGLDIRRDWLAVLQEGADLAGVDLDNHELRAPLLRPIPPPPAEPAAAPPPTAEVEALWAACLPVLSDVDIAGYLIGRGLDPAELDALDLVRVLPAEAKTPRWARCGQAWPTSGHRLLVPVVDATGALRSLRAWRPGDAQPKRVAPAGHAIAGLVIANPAARALLEAGELPPAGAVVVVEGEPDALTWSLLAPGCAVIGIVASAWSAELAARIPDGARVALRVHRDPAGDKYAAAIRATLAGREVYDFPRPSGGKGADENDRHLRGELSSDPFEGLVLTTPPRRPPTEPPPSSRLLLEKDDATSALAGALANASGLTLIRSTTGLGKSRRIRGLLAASGEAAALFVPTHRLADEHVARLAEAGVKAVAKKGVTKHLTVVRNEPSQTCKDAERADALAIMGAMPREVLCPTCKYREKHPDTGAECPAYLAMSGKADVTILQSSIAGQVLANMSATLEGEAREDERDTDGVRMVVMDEPPPIMVSVAFQTTTVASIDREWSNLTEETQESLGPLWSLVRMALEQGPLLSGMTLRQILARVTNEADITGALDDALRLDAIEWPSAIHHRIATAVGPHVGEWTTRTTHATAILGALLEACHRPDAPLVYVGQDGSTIAMHVGRWTREAARFVTAGGKIALLDATANPAEWSAFLQIPLADVRLDVRDADGVERRWVLWGSAARSKHQGKAQHLRGVLRDYAGKLTEKGARRAGLLTDKPTREWIDRTLADLAGGGISADDAACPVPPELAALVQEGLALELGHFGALRGIDAWAGADALAVVGEDWANLGISFAAADSLGLDRNTYARRKLNEEMTQAEGRSRPVHRDRPLLLVRYSKTPPDLDVAPQWAGVEPERLSAGRPRTRGADRQPVDPATWAAEREALGIGRREHARQLGISWGTYSDIEKRMSGTVREEVAGKCFKKEGEEADSTKETSSAHFPATQSTLDGSPPAAEASAPSGDTPQADTAIGPSRSEAPAPLPAPAEPLPPEVPPPAPLPGTLRPPPPSPPRGAHAPALLPLLSPLWPPPAPDKPPLPGGLPPPGWTRHRV